jgi:hypothetical protein
VRQVIRDEQPRRHQLRDAAETDEMARLLLARQRDHALRAELDPLRDRRDRLGLLEGGVLVAPEGLGRLLLAFG